MEQKHLLERLMSFGRVVAYGIVLGVFVALAASCGSTTTTCKTDGDCAKGEKCAFGTCIACSPGKELCVGVCLDLQGDNNNCGACGNRCGGQENCRGGVCVSGDCSNPLFPKRCGESCIDPLTDIRHCGACGKSCKLGQSCVGGVCSCPNGRSKCGGACVDLDADPRNCGGCGRSCPRGQVCSKGRCVTECPESTSNCFDGCVNLKRDPYNCGACGASCDLAERCNQGACGCVASQVSCDGLCVDTMTHWSHCGKCNNKCRAGQVCAAGKCVQTCPSATPTSCFGGCFDTKTSLYHCGKCGAQCSQDQRCESGKCTCGNGLTACGQLCVDLASNASHCGACENVCGAGESCDAGQCVKPSCKPNETSCSGVCADLRKDRENCGVCGQSCAPNQSCQAGQCEEKASCQPGEEVCGAICCSKEQRCCKGACSDKQVPEQCNGEDDNCDGQIDENPEGAGEACVVAQKKGPCAAGKQACIKGSFVCEQQVQPSKEICNNGVDEDCDGRPDNGCKCPTDPQARKRACYSGPAGTQSKGECQAGEQVCSDPAGWGECKGQVTPKAEVCDGKDNNCDGQIDNQTTGSGASCQTGQKGRCAVGKKQCQGGKFVCVRNHKPRAETCNNVDDDCDGSVDEGVQKSCYTGPTGTANQGICRGGTMTCRAGVWGSCSGQTLPKSETCNGKDDNCDGQIDNSSQCVCTNGKTRACGSDTGACQKGTQTCSSGAWGNCKNEIGPSTEKCDGLDNDCDGSTDENWTNLNKACSAGTGACRRSGKYVCNAAKTGVRCNVSAGSPKVESCNGKDDDCDGSIDEGLQRSCYTGPAGTEGKGRCRAGQQTCSAGSWGSCVGELKPKTETCNNVDDDCDGQLDEVCPCRQGQTRSCGTNVGECSKGTQGCTTSFQWGACTGGTSAVSEKCDGRDNDCDGSTDENWSSLGRPCNVGTGACRRSGMYVCNTAKTGIKCNVTAGSPQTESCNGVDDDCDGSVDEGIAPRACYTGSASTRNKGICKDGTQTCSGGGWSSTCSGQVLPKTESCNGADDDCDGSVDDNIAPRACYTGSTSTRGVGACRDGTQTCVSGSWSGCLGQVLPKTESCNNKDDDCDGSKDEGTGGGVCYFKGTISCNRGSLQCLNGLLSCQNFSVVRCTSNSQCAGCPPISRSCISGICGGPEP